MARLTTRTYVASARSPNDWSSGAKARWVCGVAIAATCALGPMARGETIEYFLTGAGAGGRSIYANYDIWGYDGGRDLNVPPQITPVDPGAAFQEETSVAGSEPGATAAASASQSSSVLGATSFSASGATGASGSIAAGPSYPLPDGSSFADSASNFTAVFFLASACRVTITGTVTGQTGGANTPLFEGGEPPATYTAYLRLCPVWGTGPDIAETHVGNYWYNNGLASNALEFDQILPAGGYTFVAGAGAGIITELWDVVTDTPVGAWNAQASYNFTFSATPALWTLQVQAPQGSGTTDPDTGSYPHDVVGAYVAPISAIPAPNWHFTGWVGTAVPPAHETDNPITVSSGTMDQTLTLQALFARDQWTLEILAPEGHGTTNPDTGGYGHNVGAAVVGVEAVPDTDWHFVRWQGTAVPPGHESDNPITVPSGTKDQTLTLQAVFARDRWTLEILVTQFHGTTDPDAGDYEYDVGTDAVAVEAVPDTDWHFEHWQGTAVPPGHESGNPITVPSGTKDQTRTLQAVFAPDEGTLTVTLSSPSLAFTRAGPVTYTVTYSGASTVALLPTNVLLNRTGTASGTVAVTGAGISTRTVTISGITGSGRLGISLAAGTASGATGSQAPAVGPSEMFTADNTPPTGTITINSGADHASSTQVTLSLTADDAGGGDVSGMRFSNDGRTWSAWEPFTATRAWTLVTGAGLKTVRVQYQDNVGNTSLTMSDSITLVSSLSVTALSRTTQAGLTATLSCTASLAATEYAVMEGAWNPATADWEPITGGTASSSGRTFACTLDLQPTVGTHTVYMAVRNPDLGLTSAARSLSVGLTGPAVYSLSVTKVSGATATLAITVTGNPSQYAILEGAWNTGAAVWKTIPAGIIVSGRLRFATDFTLLPTAGTHTLYVAVRDPVTTLTSATKTITITLAGPTMSALSSAGVARTTVTLRATAKGGPDQYAVMEGVWNVGAAVWQPITGATATSTSLTFSFPFVLTPEARAHTVYVAVRNSLLNAASAARSVTVTVARPTVTSITPASGPAGSALVTLTGTAFGPTAGGAAKVEFAGVPALIQSWSNTSVRCIVPAAAPLGAVNVILTTSAGLQALPRLFTVLPFWYGNWVGTFQDTADTAIGAGALEHGWMNGSTTALPDGSMSLRLGTGEILTGSVNASDGSFDLTGTGRDGSDLTLTGIVTADSLTGTLDWTGDDGSGSRDLALGRPGVAAGVVSGTYVVTVEDQFDSRGLPPVPKAMLLAGSQTGGTVTLRDAVTAEVLAGPLIGDVFVVFSATRTIYGHVTSVNTSGQVAAFEATYDWADAASFGWGEVSAGRSDGTAGVSRGTTLWNLNAVTAGGPTLLPATVVVGYSNAVTVTVSGLGGVQHIARGKVYHNPDGGGSTFVARDPTLTLFGFWNGAALDGGLEHQDSAIPFDSGDFTGTPR